MRLRFLIGLFYPHLPPILSSSKSLMTLACDHGGTSVVCVQVDAINTKRAYTFWLSALAFLDWHSVAMLLLALYLTVCRE